MAELQLYPPFAGSHLQPCHNPAKVIIVGGGLAGMAAGLRLKQAGHEVKVLEKGSRPGGRLLTFRDLFADGLHVEVGAAFLMSQHTYTQGFIKELGLAHQLRHLNHEGESVVLSHLIDDPVSMTRNEDIPGLNPWEKKHGPEEWFQNALGAAAEIFAAAGDPRAPGWPPRSLDTLDNQSLEAVMRAGKSLSGMPCSDVAYSVMRRGYVDLMGDGAPKTAALEMVRDLFLNELITADGSTAPMHHARVRHLSSGYTALANPLGASNSPAPDEAGAKTSPEDYNLQGGNDQIAWAFAMKLAESLELYTEVRSVTDLGERVSIECVRPQGPLTMEADYVICAVPTSALRRMHFLPGPPKEQAEAWELYLPTHVSRIYLEFDERFWRTVPPKGLSGVASTNLPHVTGQSLLTPGIWVNNQTANQPGRAGVLECYVAGLWAERFGAMDPKKRAEVAISQIDKVFPGAQLHWTGAYTSKHWHHAYSWFRPGTMARALHAGPRPFGRVHLAGDEYSVLPGWTQGALESGVAAARAVNEACGA